MKKERLHAELAETPKKATEKWWQVVDKPDPTIVKLLQAHTLHDSEQAWLFVTLHNANRMGVPIVHIYWLKKVLRVLSIVCKNLAMEHVKTNCIIIPQAIVVWTRSACGHRVCCPIRFFRPWRPSLCRPNCTHKHREALSSIKPWTDNIFPHQLYLHSIGQEECNKNANHSYRSFHSILKWCSECSP